MRKALGGQLRQVGLIAAAGHIALRDMPSVLSEDHRCAKLLAESLVSIQGLSVDLEAVETNMVVVDVSQVCENTAEIIAYLEGRGILSAPLEKGQLRLVTHHQVREKEVERAVQAFRDFARK